MKEIKRTPVPLPRTKLKKPSSSIQAPPKQALSQETVHDSDDSSSEAISNSKTAKKTKSATTIAVHRPKINGVATSTSKTASRAQATSKPAPKKTPGSKKVVKEAQVLSDTSSSEESEEESEDSENGDKTAQKGNGKASTSTSSSDSSSEESDEEENVPAVAQNKALKDQSKPAQSHTVEMRQTQPFVPPKGFVAVPTSNSSSKAAKLFENVEGKQIWHITAPANVPMKNLKDLALEKALNGGSILSHEGSEYGLSSIELSEQGAREVLVPRQNGYKAVSAPIARTLHLQQVLAIPKISSKQTDQNTGSAAAASIIRSTIRAPRPQVTGLKMRFFPTGSGSNGPEVLGDSDSEEELSNTREIAGLGVSQGAKLVAKPEKRKHGLERNERAESPTKKPKKHRTPEEIKKREEKKAKKDKKKQKDSTKS